MGGNQVQQDNTAPLVAEHGYVQASSRSHQQKLLKPWDLEALEFRSFPGASL